MRNSTINEIKNYKEFISNEDYSEIIYRSNHLRNLRVIHVSATSYGGGVSEILNSLIPLMNNLNIITEWFVLPNNETFFKVTKKIHNALQGSNIVLLDSEKRIYVEYCKNIAKILNNYTADIWIIHDPQPLGLIKYLSKNVCAIWRCHIDTYKPNVNVWKFIRQFLDYYNVAIFSLRDFIPNDLKDIKRKVFYPAIDPLSNKNKLLESKISRKILKNEGISIENPILTQVSRFDIWKNQKGVIDVYRKLKKHIPNIQLALIGLIIANDDLEALKMYKEIKLYADNDPNIFMFADPKKILIENDLLVNAFQSNSDIIIQLSLKEAFGLVVTEALWKKKFVVGTKALGIKVQIENFRNGFLINDLDDCTDIILKILKNKEKYKYVTEEAHNKVKEKFILPRLLNDYLKLFEECIKM